jgi:hypothetical protein
MSATLTTDATGNLLIKLFTTDFFGFAGNSFYFAGLTIEGVIGGGGTVTFSELIACDPGDPVIEPPPEPPPPMPPPPVDGERYLGVFNLPIEGLGDFDATVKILTVANALNTINKAIAANTRLYVFFGDQASWLDASGKYSKTKHKAVILAILAAPGVAAAVATAVSLGLLVHFVIDEPWFKSTRYGGTIPIGDVEEVCVFSKVQVPSLITMISARPLQQKWWLTRHINGLDWLECAWSFNMGDCATSCDANLARAAELEHGCLFAPHIAHIEYPSAGSRAITSAEWRTYGIICASRSTNIGMLSWKWTAELFAQADWWAATRDVKNTLA